VGHVPVAGSRAAGTQRQRGLVPSPRSVLIGSSSSGGDADTCLLCRAAAPPGAHFCHQSARRSAAALPHVGASGPNQTHYAAWSPCTPQNERVPARGFLGTFQRSGTKSSHTSRRSLGRSSRPRAGCSRRRPPSQNATTAHNVRAPAKRAGQPRSASQCTVALRPNVSGQRARRSPRAGLAKGRAQWPICIGSGGWVRKRPAGS
jgi:hypothetical protein